MRRSKKDSLTGYNILAESIMSGSDKELISIYDIVLKLVRPSRNSALIKCEETKQTVAVIFSKTNINFKTTAQ
jgi:hypothetical protein